MIVAAALILMAALSPLLASWDKVQSQELVARLDPPDRAHWMGRDQLGRDMMARIIYGARVSMLVGLSVVTISALFGVLIGSFAGYKGGWTDRIISGFLFNIFLSFPGILLAIAMVAFLGPSVKNLIIALSVIGPDVWFFKLTGPPDTVDKNREAFAGFLKSLKFAPEGDAK